MKTISKDLNKKKEENRKLTIQRKAHEKRNNDFFILQRQREREFTFKKSIRSFHFFNEIEELETFAKKMKKTQRKDEIIRIKDAKVRATKFNLLIIFHSKRYWNSDVFMTILTFI
jgi:hypothetical protein